MVLKYACIAALVAFSSGAGAWVQRMEHTWPIGEHESRAKARELAIEAMRVKAANAVGKIVEATSTLKDGELREEVRTVGVSMVKVSDIKDSLRLNPDGSSVLLVSATVDVDEAELKRRAEQMRTDRDLAKQVGLLRKENGRLREELGALGRSLATSVSDPLSLWRRQQELMASLRENEEQVGNSFRPGILLALADASEEEWVVVKKDIDKVLVSVLNMPVRAAIKSSTRTGGQDPYMRVAVSADWSLPIEQISGLLSKYFYPIDQGKFVYLEAGKEHRHGLTHKAYKYLAGNEVWVEFKLGAVVKRLRMLGEWHASNFDPCIEERGFLSSSKFRICRFQASLGNAEGGADRDKALEFYLRESDAAAVDRLRVFVVLKQGANETRREVR